MYEKGVDLCEQTIRKQLKEMRFPSRKAKHKPSITPKEKKTRLKMAEEKQP